MKRNLDHKTVTIYTLTNPETGLIFYVGQTTMPLLRRLHCHWTVIAEMNERYNDIIAYLRKKKLRPIIEEVDTCPYKDKRDTECFWIQTISGWGFDLVNYRHNSNKNYVSTQDKKRQRDLRLKVLTLEEVTVIKELYKFGDHSLISNNTEVGAERVRQILSQIINGTKKKMPFYIHGVVFDFYYKRAEKIYNIYSQKLQNDNSKTVC